MNQHSISLIHSAERDEYLQPDGSWGPKETGRLHSRVDAEIDHAEMKDVELIDFSPSPDDVAEFFIVVHSLYFDERGNPLCYSGDPEDPWNSLKVAKAYASKNEVPKIDGSYKVQGYASADKTSDLLPAVSVEDETDAWFNPGTPCWAGHGPFSIHSTLTDEGIVVDIYPLGNEYGESLASTYAYFAEVPGVEYRNERGQ